MKILKAVTFCIAVLLTIVLIWLTLPVTAPEPTSSLRPETSVATDTIKFDTRTGLIADENLNLVIANCTGCHSSKLIQQHRFSRDGWTGKIRWMQKNHNLWDLGASEQRVLDYLEKYYSPKSEVNRVRARRAPLENIEWYQL